MEASRAHARRSDPVSSDQTVKSIAQDQSLRGLVLRGANASWVSHQRQQRVRPSFTDTELTAWIEKVTGKRQQRNVIARTRGLIEKEGHIIRTGTHTVDGRLMVHFVITESGRNLFNV